MGYSALLTASAAGGLVGGIVLESAALLRPRSRTAIICAVLWCLAIGGFAVTSSYPLALALLFVGGFLNLAYASMAQTLVQLRAPARVRGSAIGLLSASQWGLRVGSGITVGALGSVIGVHASLGLSTTVLLGLTLILLRFARADDAEES